VVTTETFELAIGTAYMQELERLDRALEPDSGEQRLAHRLSSYVTATVRVNERFRVAETAYAQPRIDRPSDVRVLSESELLFSITDVVLLKVSFALGYDSFPPDGRHALDTVTKTGFQLRLR
jgi:hypothetical protein